MVKVIPIQQIGADERGTTHVFDTDRTGQFIIAYRKAGSARSAAPTPTAILRVAGVTTTRACQYNTHNTGDPAILQR